MQKVVVNCLIVCLLFAACAKSESPKPAPEAAQQILKLRGYEFDEKNYFAAVQARDLMALNAFFDAGMNPNVQDHGEGRTALIWAAVRGDIEMVNAVLARGVDVNIQDKRGYTALMHAVEKMYDNVTDALLNQPALNPNVRGLNGRPALHAFVWRDDKERVARLLAHGADVNATDADGDTALHGAAQSDDTKILQMLLDKGANPNAKNRQGGTPLMWAAVYGKREAARVLLSRGADPALKDNDGVTAAEWAARNKRDNVVSLLRGARR